MAPRPFSIAREIERDRVFTTFNCGERGILPRLNTTPPRSGLGSFALDFLSRKLDKKIYASSQYFLLKILLRCSNPSILLHKNAACLRRSPQKVAGLLFAEREGFEPSKQFYPLDTLAPCCLRPLGHLSNFPRFGHLYLSADRSPILATIPCVPPRITSACYPHAIYIK